MGLGGAAGTVSYSAAELGRFGSGWTLIDIGNTAQTGATTVGATAWSDPVHFRANAAGSVVISGGQTAGAASDTTFTFTGPASLAANVDTTNATGGTQAITFNGTAAVNADITSDGGDVAFNNMLSLGADILTGGGDITLADDVTLTGTSSIDTDSADIAFAGALDGAQGLTLSTTGDVDFSDDAGAGTALGALAIAGAADVTFSGALETASLTLTGGTGAVLVTSAANVGGDIDLTTAGAVTFADNVTYGGDVAIDSGASDITFNGTLDGPGDMELTTTNDILFVGDVGGVTRLGDVTIDPRHFTAGAFNAASFTLTNGTGNVSFGGAGLNTTGNISIDTNGNVTGTYAGANGLFDAGRGKHNSNGELHGAGHRRSGSDLKRRVYRRARGGGPDDGEPDLDRRPAQPLADGYSQPGLHLRGLPDRRCRRHGRRWRWGWRRKSDSACLSTASWQRTRAGNASRHRTWRTAGDFCAGYVCRSPAG